MNRISLMGRLLDAAAPLPDRLEAMRDLLSADLRDGTFGSSTETAAYYHLRALEVALGECSRLARAGRVG